MTHTRFRARIVALQQQCGAGLMEFGVVVAILGILMFILLQRVLFYQAQAEQVAVAQVVADVRSALHLRVAERNMAGRRLDMTVLAEQNPFSWLERKPANYAGEYYSPSPQDVAPGNWYFDRGEKVLVYLLNNEKSFGGASVKRLKFKVKLLRLPTDNAKPSGAPEIDGVAFDQVTG